MDVMLALAIKLRDEATAAGKNFKIRVDSDMGQEFPQWLTDNGYNADGTRDEPLPVAYPGYLISTENGTKSVRTIYRRYESNVIRSIYFKDYDAEKLPTPDEEDYDGAE